MDGAAGEAALVESSPDRLLRDVQAVLAALGDRHRKAMQRFYPEVAGRQPWGYLWATTLPCQECGARFPLVGSYDLRLPSTKKDATGNPMADPGQSFHIAPNSDRTTFRVVLRDGPPTHAPTLRAASTAKVKTKGKAACCPFCNHVHDRAVHQRLSQAKLGQDTLLLVADFDDVVGKRFRLPTSAELTAVAEATAALGVEPPFGPLLAAVPNEEIAIGNSTAIRPSGYGATHFGDLMCSRQTLSYIRFCRLIDEMYRELLAQGVSHDYARSLAGYAGACVARKIRRSTRAATLAIKRDGVSDIFQNEANIGFSYDFFETGIGEGPGTWDSISSATVSTLKNLLAGIRGVPGSVQRGSATDLPFADASMTAVVTDPPYDEMIAYADSSDLFYVWLKRALVSSHPELAATTDAHGAQEKDNEIIVKSFRAKRSAVVEHRTREHYDKKIAQAFAEMRRVVGADGVVTIVFGHGDPEVWQRLLTALSAAGLVLTGSWPARTEAGGQQGATNIVTTLTMACRPAPRVRPEGRKAAIEAEIKTEIANRYPDWERWGLAPTDMLMAASGPAMEVAGRYSVVRDARANPIDIATFLPLARAAVQESMAVHIDHHPLEVFDARTRFALWWVRVYGRDLVAKSELRWQALAASMDVSEVRDLVPDTDRGCRFGTAIGRPFDITPDSATIDIALAMASALADGLDAVAEVLVASGRDADVDDPYLWAAIAFLADRLPDTDPDAIAWTRILRNRTSVSSATKAVVTARVIAQAERATREVQLTLL
jgi:adenine-specific DNA methylase